MTKDCWYYDGWFNNTSVVDNMKVVQCKGITDIFVSATSARVHYLGNGHYSQIVTEQKRLLVRNIESGVDVEFEYFGLLYQALEGVIPHLVLIVVDDPANLAKCDLELVANSFLYFNIEISQPVYDELTIIRREFEQKKKQ